MKLNDKDRQMAIARCPDYIKDYNEYRKFNDETLALDEAISKKLGPGAHPFDENVRQLYERINKEVEMHKEVLKKWHLEKLIPPNSKRETLTPRKPVELMSKDEWPKAISVYDKEAGQFVLKEGASWSGPILPPDFSRFCMMLRVDLARSNEDLKDAFEGVIQEQKISWVKEHIKGNDKPRKYDPWEIYDRLKDGSDYKQIAIDLYHRYYPSEPKGSVDERNLDTLIRGVCRAYDAALEMIQEVERRYIAH